MVAICYDYNEVKHLVPVQRAGKSHYVKHVSVTAFLPARPPDRTPRPETWLGFVVEEADFEDSGLYVHYHNPDGTPVPELGPDGYMDAPIQAPVDPNDPAEFLAELREAVLASPPGDAVFKMQRLLDCMRAFGYAEEDVMAAERRTREEWSMAQDDRITRRSENHDA